MNADLFSWARFAAVARKEFIQMRRDRLTFAMMVGIPILQLVLFGFAINADPKHLPAAVVSAESTDLSRSFVTAVEHSGYFRVVAQPKTLAQAERLLELGDVQFVLEIPSDFTRRLIRGERPALRVEADATDPATASNALAAVLQLGQGALSHDLKGALGYLNTGAPPFELRVQRRYNPENITQYNIVPGLMGVVLTMTMIVMTALAVTRELERGTMENLLATPVLPFEVLLGKIVPYIFVGYVQVTVVLLAAHDVFGVPIAGSLLLLLACVLAFILANLTVGITFSSLARNQMQAMQMGFFFFLPSILLSGFMFPFRGMPEWAQDVGEVLPLTHFLRIVRGVMLKGHGIWEVWPNLWPLLAFMAAMMVLGVLRYRRTLD